jgi:hypothetical protein
MSVGLFLTYFVDDLHNLRGILLKYLQETEELNYMNYLDFYF